MHRLNWGCGPITPYGWINSDVYPWPGVDLVGDIRGGLPLSEGTIDYIVSIHALCDLPYIDLDRALAELHRVLKPGGVLRLGLPDMDKAIAAYKAKEPDYFFLVPDSHVKSLSGKMIAQLTWFGQTRCMFTLEFTSELLARNGFHTIRESSFRETASQHPGITELDNRPHESFFIEAVK